MGENPCCVCLDDNEDLIFKCKRCVYPTCGQCILSMRTSKIKTSLCKDSACRYDYLEPDEQVRVFNYNVCSKIVPKVMYPCPVCKTINERPIDQFEESLLKFTSSRRVIEKPTLNTIHKLVCFTIYDIDNDQHSLYKFFH